MHQQLGQPLRAQGAVFVEIIEGVTALELRRQGGPQRPAREGHVAPRLVDAVIAREGNVETVVQELTPLVSKQLKSSSEEAAAFVRDLARRKLKEFPDDFRRVMDVGTYWRNGEVQVIALSAYEK